ncbi:MAG TPA: hypothetical protein VFX98_11405 [Longimicrobiaceae bacterium]|nr:hypothetical protein [Longimicrobiaceae bacterium]
METGDTERARIEVQGRARRSDEESVERIERDLDAVNPDADSVPRHRERDMWERDSASELPGEDRTTGYREED